MVYEGPTSARLLYIAENKQKYIKEQRLRLVHDDRMQALRCSLLQVFCKPIHDMVQTFQAHLWMTTAGKSMTLPLKNHKLYVTLHIFESCKKLLSLLKVAALILLTV